jgi:hypothetical protein
MVRGEKSAAASSSRSTISDKEAESTISKATISTTKSGFKDAAFKNGVLDVFNSRPPANLDSLQNRPDRTRDSASPTELQSTRYKRKMLITSSESSVLMQSSKLLKEYDCIEYNTAHNQAFTAFPKNVGFNNGLSPAKPDLIEGFIMSEYEPFPIRDELGGAAVITPGPNAITLPHLAGEWKSQGKDMTQAETQAAFDGACMVYGRNEALSYLGKSDPPGHAYVFTFTIDGTTLNTFAHYSSRSEGQVKYHIYPINSTFLSTSHKDFKTAQRRLRNLQDYAKELSEALRDELKEVWLKDKSNKRGYDNREDSVDDVLVNIPTPESSSPAAPKQQGGKQQKKRKN